MADTIASLIREYELRRKERRGRQYAGYWAGQELLLKGERKRKQDLETYNAINEQMKLWHPDFQPKPFGEIKNIGTYQQEVNAEREARQLKTEAEFFGVPTEEVPLGELALKTKEAQRTKRGEEALSLYEKRIRLGKELGKEYEEKPTGIAPTEVPAEPFTKKDFIEMPNWEDVFDKPSRTQKDKLNLIFNQGYTIYPKEMLKTINFYNREIEKVETREKEDVERKEIKEELSKYKVEEKNGKITKLLVMIGGSWKEYDKKTLKKAQKSKYDSSLKNIYEQIENYKRLKKREEELKIIPLPLDTETEEREKKSKGYFAKKVEGTESDPMGLFE